MGINTHECLFIGGWHNMPATSVNRKHAQIYAHGYTNKIFFFLLAEWLLKILDFSTTLLILGIYDKLQVLENCKLGMQNYQKWSLENKCSAYKKVIPYLEFMGKWENSCMKWLVAIFFYYISVKVLPVYNQEINSMFECCTWMHILWCLLLCMWHFLQSFY